MTKDEALKLALEFIENSECGTADLEARIKKALAQEQEPVAWRKREVGGGWQYYGWKETGMTYESVNRFNKNGFECEAIPATPPQRTWQGLTAGEILDTLISVDEKTVRLPAMLGQFACAIEAKLKEKNT